MSVVKYTSGKENQTLLKSKLYTFMLGDSVLSILNPFEVQLKFTYRVFRECINLYDAGKNFGNTKKQTFNLLH
jgi:hypothetical protein